MLELNSYRFFKALRAQGSGVTRFSDYRLAVCLQFAAFSLGVYSMCALGLSPTAESRR